MLDKPNILNIPANYHFFRSLLDLLEKNFPKNLSQAKIFLPNRRSCRQFCELFLEKKPVSALPKIKAISDISCEDLFSFLPNYEVKQMIDEAEQIKVLSGVDYLFFLSTEIQKLGVFGHNLEFSQALKIASNLADLFDTIEREEVDLKKLEEIDDSNLSAHRQVTLKFLKDFYIQIKNHLLKKNTLFGASYQNFIIQQFVEALSLQPSSVPIIVAGSTGSVSFSKKLIKKISEMENGYVILHGLTSDEFFEENHPQFYLNQLLKLLAVEKKTVRKIAEEKFLLSDKTRQDLLSLMMLPSEETVKWQKIPSLLDAKKAAQDLLENFQIIEAPNEIKEAKLIALALLSATKKFGQNSALITNNNKLAKLVKLELKRLNLPFNDARNLGILHSQLINFLILILELNESDFDSTSLLALLKHPLFYNSKNQEILNNFEIKVLRKERSSLELEGINSKLESLQEKELSDFFADFYERLKISQDHSLSLLEQIENLIKTAESLSNKTWLELVETEAARAEIDEFFERLKAQNNISFAEKSSMLATFKALLGQISYFEKNHSFASIQILSTHEARLLNYDLVIVASLNEGDFPEISSENWLGKKIKKDLEIDHSLKKIGQSAYDFCNYLSNKKVILTRCKSRNGAVLIESPFLLKLKTICKKLAVNIEDGQKYFEELQKINRPALKEIKPIVPKPKSILRPKKISITEISKLISNPYSIYAKKILGLKELEKIDFESSYAEFGVFVHQALEDFVKNPKAKNFLKKSEKLFEKYFISKEAKLIWWPKFENIFADFLVQNSQFSGFINHVETPVKLALNGITISGKIDRIILNEHGFVEIFDYKTGQIPTTKNVVSGIDPQLTISALALVEGIIEAKFSNINAEKIQSLNYWKLSSSTVGEIKKICAKNEEIKILLSAAKAGLSRLFDYFSDENNGYIATKNSDKNEYWHLERGN